MAVQNPRRKNTLQLSKINYEKACFMFKHLEEHYDLINATLERVALLELQAQSK